MSSAAHMQSSRCVESFCVHTYRYKVATGEGEPVTVQMLQQHVRFQQVVPVFL